MTGADYIRPAAVPSDGRPRRLDAGWFAAFRVTARSRELAIIQARIAVTLKNLTMIDVVSADDQGDADATWIVELQIEAPASGVIGL